MVRFCNIVILIFNAFGVIASINIILRASNWITNGHSGCGEVLPKRDLVVGIFMLVLSLLGIICAIWQVRVLQSIFLSLCCILVIAMLVLAGFLVYSSTSAKDDEHPLERYPPWLRRYLGNEKKWADFKSCMMQKQVCQRLPHDEKQQFYMRLFLTPSERHQSYIQSGCCKPPSLCGFKKKNATYWEVQNLGHVWEDNDCFIWDNKRDKLCYDCDSCKAGYIETYKRNWDYLHRFYFFESIFLLFISCYAFSDDGGGKNTNRKPAV